ncbi:gephyrin-like molybdotransferase Glp [uncultured Desulfuromusa sp.]|uniref:molybdopterin molybdotransferase MoeA n=1 Tax=uncultured Desulfuromusa sp. TaxID=219183 RepID=UPI002AA70FAB|nr:gephyrin-like molybdotransferase Glp [uncultured Desulfuromusa sp.]
MIKSFLDARNLILDNTLQLEAESVPLVDLVGRILTRDFHARWDMPRWDNSEMDGFAVNALSCRHFVQLLVAGYIPAGSSAEGFSVRPGTAVRIMTGAPIPAGCDAVVPIENTEFDGERVTIKKAVKHGDYIRFRGSDISADEVMISTGSVLRPAEINLLASFSLESIPVFRRPRVAILSTGDELVAPGEIPAAGQIIDGNSWSLAAAVKEIGATPVLLGIAQDNDESLGEKIALGLKADVLITSAGVSTGDRDLVREALENAGVKPVFWKVSMKPGGPTAFGLQQGKPVFSLPGNPVSSMIGFEELVRPALLKMMGYQEVLRPLNKARVRGVLANESGKTRFLRVRVEKTATGLVAKSAGDQNTGILSTMIRANAIAILAAEQTRFSHDDEVDVQLLGEVERPYDQS